MPRTLFLLLMLLAAPLYAAEPDAEAPAAESEEPAIGATNDSTLEAEDPALAEEIRAAEEAAASEPPSDSNEPFIPTVQISEDLSVAFPVDI